MRLRPETLEEYVTKARNILIEVARKEGAITYGELMEEMGGPGRGYIGRVLKAVCEGERRQGRPLLGSLVVRAGAGHPGDGYWDSPAAPKGSRQEKMDFWQKERQRVYEYWRKDPTEG